MNGFLLVALGGAIGACARYGVGLLTTQHGGLEGWWATLIVNVTGSAIMGGLLALLAIRGPLQEQALWLLLGVGMLGAFTTFSSFSKDAVELLMAGETLKAVGYMAANMIGSVGAFALAFMMLRQAAS